MPAKIILSEETIKLIIQEYLNNKSLNEISNTFNITRTKIKAILIENNINLRSRSKVTELAQQKAKQTIKKKYGVTNVFQLETTKEKIKQTNKLRYGCEYVSQSKDIRAKIKNAYLESLGVDNPLKDKDIYAKIRQTCLEKYGYESPMQNELIKEKVKQTKLDRYNNATYNNGEKSKQTCLDRYNAEFPAKNELVKAKMKQTCLEKYGVSNYAETDDYKNKVRQTCLNKYGVPSYSCTNDFHCRAKKRYVYNNLYFDSMPEVALYVFALDHNLKIERCPIRFEFIYNEKLHYYFPDFRLDGQLIEIKGDQFFKEDGTMQNPYDHSQDGLYEAKHQCGLINKVNFIRSADYKKYIEYLNEHYDLNEFVIVKEK